jgi:peroxiredoxin Q/BCP
VALRVVVVDARQLVHDREMSFSPVVVFRCHALWAPLLRRSAHSPPVTGDTPGAADGPVWWSRLRPPDANGIGDNEGPKTTKGRHMASELTAGDKAPAFSLPRDGGTKVSLKDFKGRNLVLYFYPKADTPGCTQEAIAFSGLRAAFAKTGTEILGVSADPVAAQDKFKTKHKLTVGLASDETKEMLQAYGAWGEKSMYGRKFMGVIRKTFLIDGAGRIVRVWPKVSVPGHAEEVLETVRSI